MIDPEDRTTGIWTGPSLPGRELTGGDALASPLPRFSLALSELFS